MAAAEDVTITDRSDASTGSDPGDGWVVSTPGGSSGDVNPLISNTLLKGEKVLYTVECTIITALSKTPGTLTLTPLRLFFTPTNTSKAGHK